MKCIPITFSGLLVTAAICVIEIEEVFVAKIVSEPQAASMSLKIFNFKSTFSVAASTTKSTFLTPSCILVKVVMLFNVLFLVSEVFE